MHPPGRRNHQPVDGGGRSLMEAPPPQGWAPSRGRLVVHERLHERVRARLAALTALDGRQYVARRRIAIIGPLARAPVRHGGQVWRQQPVRRGRDAVAAKHSRDGRRQGAAFEGIGARGQFGDERAERELIGARVHVESQQLLGRHVARRAGHEAGHREAGDRRQSAGLALEARQAEVEDLHPPVGQAEHVLGLQIAVHDAARVRHDQRRRQRLRHGERAIARQRTALHHRPQGLAVEILAADVGVAVDVLERVDRGDVRMHEGRRRAGLVPQALLLERVGRAQRRHGLERHAALQPRVFGLEHHAHAAAPEHTHQVVGPDDGARAELRKRRIGDLGNRHGINRVLEKAFRAVVRVQQRRHLAAHVGRHLAGGEPRRPRVVRLGQRAREQVADHAPPIGGHVTGRQAPSSGTRGPASSGASPWRATRPPPPRFPPRSVRRSSATRRCAPAARRARPDA